MQHLFDLFADSATCVLPAQLHQCIASGVSVCCLKFPSHNTRRPAQPASHRFLSDAAAMSPTLRLTCAESGHIISDNPERVRASSSHILHCEVAFLPPFAAYGRWPKSGPVRQWRHKRNELRHKAQRRAATNRPRQKPKPGRRPQFCQPITVTQELPEDRDEVTRLLNGALKPFRGDPLGSKPREYLARICCLLAASVRYPQTQPMHAGCHSRSSMRQAFHSSLHVSFKFLSLAAFGVCSAEAPLQNYGVSSESQS